LTFFRCFRVCAQFDRDLVHLVAVLLEIEERDPPDRHAEQHLDVVVVQLPAQLLPQRLETLVHLAHDRLGGLCLLQALIDAVLDEEPDQALVMQVQFQLVALQLEFALQQVDQLLRVRPQHLRHGHLHRPLVADDDDPAVQGLLALREGVQRVHQLLGIDSLGHLDRDLHLLGGEIVDRPDLQFPLPGGVLDRPDQRIGGGPRRDLGDHHGVLVLDPHPGADADAAPAVVVLLGVHQAAGGKVGDDLEGAALEDGDLGFEQLDEVVGQDAGGQADRDALGTEHEEERQLAGQRDRLLVAAVVGRNELGELVVEQLRPRQFGQARLDVAGGGGGDRR
jgi:hypothetical protein